MRFGRVASLVVGVFIAMPAVPASAACAPGCEAALDAFSFRTEYLWSGQTETWSIKTFVDKTVAGPDDGPFYAYLVEPNRRAARVPRVEGGVVLGQVETGSTRASSSFDASVTFTVPAITPIGSYAVEVCDDPCTTRLGYIGPTSVQVVSGVNEARLLERIDALSQKVLRLRSSIKSNTARVNKKLSKELREQTTLMEEKLDMRISELALRVTDLERQLAEQKEPSEREDVAQSALAGGVVVLLLCGWLIRERARNRQSCGPWAGQSAE